jgi:hypothetical protein
MKELLSFLNFDAKTQDGITNITVWLAILVYFLFINFFIVPVNVPNEPSNYSLYLFVLFVPAAIKLIFFSGDPISYKKNKEALFFQAQFPDAYIVERFKIEKSLAQNLWFTALDKRQAEGAVKRTYQYGYTCRLVYYTRRLMGAFAVLSGLYLLGDTAWIYLRSYHCWIGYPAIWTSFATIYNLKGKILYLLHVGGISLYLFVANRTGKEPTGVWGRWKHINDRNKAWVDQFVTLEAFQSFVAPDNRPPAPGNKA